MERMEHLGPGQRPGRGERYPHSGRAFWQQVVSGKTCRILMVAIWGSLVIISLNHLYSFSGLLSGIPAFFLGITGWLAALMSILCLGRGDLPKVGVAALAAFCLGLGTGTYLDPPADSFEHLRRVHEMTCGQPSSTIPRSNRGLWHYSMLNTIVCPDSKPVDIDKVFFKVHLANGLLWALACSALCITALRIGLPFRWAFFSMCICFLFFGTNRFSYFRYYSMAPSFTSMVIYWTWAGVFFFTTSSRNMIQGMLVAAALVPVLWVNHSQEAIFLVFLVIVWSVVNFFVTVDVNCWTEGNKLREYRCLFKPQSKRIIAIILLFLLWGLPQSEMFREWLAGFFLPVAGPEYYKYLWVNWRGWYVGPVLRGIRIADTTGYIVLAGVILGIPYFWPGVIPGSRTRKIKIFVLAVLPFIGYIIPFFHFIWSSNLLAQNYYRLCYASMFWLFFADLLYGLEARASTAIAGLMRCKRSEGNR